MVEGGFEHPPRKVLTSGPSAPRRKLPLGGFRLISRPGCPARRYRTGLWRRGPRSARGRSLPRRRAGFPIPARRGLVCSLSSGNATRILRVSCSATSRASASPLLRCSAYIRCSCEAERDVGRVYDHRVSVAPSGRMGCQTWGMSSPGPGPRPARMSFQVARR